MSESFRHNAVVLPARLRGRLAPAKLTYSSGFETIDDPNVISALRFQDGLIVPVRDQHLGPYANARKTRFVSRPGREPRETPGPRARN